MEHSTCEACGETTSLQSSFLTLDSADMPDIIEHLRSHTWPSAENPHFADVSHEGPEQLAQYDAEIERLRTKISRLSDKRQQLETYVDACRALFSPIRRLPNELLEKIFSMCSPLSARKMSDTDSSMQEVHRLAKRHLLDLSKVCARWHGIVMDTPTLWSLVVVNTALWLEPLDRMPPIGWDRIHLLERLLERSGACPLVIDFAGEELFPSAGRALQMLMDHAERWQRAYVRAPLHAFRNLGNLPLLELLHLADDGAGDSDMYVFEAAPRLKYLEFRGPASRVPQIPWSQLKSFLHWHVPDDMGELYSSLCLMNKLSDGTKFILDVDLDQLEPPFTLPPISSELSALAMLLTACFDTVDLKGILQSIFEALTTPKLHTLELHRNWDAPAIPFWPHDAFTAFAERSSLGESLTRLEIHIRITDEQLLECLPMFPRLETLIISDCTKESENVLITDTLLRRLTIQADPPEAALPPLVPVLHFFWVSSILRFSDEVYWDFLLSRLELGKTPERPFQARLYWLEPRERTFSDDTSSRIVALVRERRLGFDMGRDPDEPQLD